MLATCSAPRYYHGSSPSPTPPRSLCLEFVPTGSTEANTFSYQQNLTTQGSDVLIQGGSLEAKSENKTLRSREHCLQGSRLEVGPHFLASLPYCPSTWAGGRAVWAWQPYTWVSLLFWKLTLPCQCSGLPDIFHPSPTGTRGLRGRLTGDAFHLFSPHC